MSKNARDEFFRSYYKVNKNKIKGRQQAVKKILEQEGGSKMNQLKWLNEKEIATLTDWEVIQIIRERTRPGGMLENVTEFLCLLKRVK